jgi:hypothetical protein
MTINELKAFIEGMDIPEGKQPTADQWARVLKKLDAVQEIKLGNYRSDTTYPNGWSSVPRTSDFYPRGITTTI